MTKKKALVTVTVAGLVCASIWLFAEPGWEPLVTALGLVAALIAELATGSGAAANTPSMTQKGGKGSRNTQVGGNVTIH